MLVTRLGKWFTMGTTWEPVNQLGTSREPLLAQSLGNKRAKTVGPGNHLGTTWEPKSYWFSRSPPLGERGTRLGTTLREPAWRQSPEQDQTIGARDA